MESDHLIRSLLTESPETMIRSDLPLDCKIPTLVTITKEL